MLHDMGETLGLWAVCQNQRLVMGSAAPDAGQPGLGQDQGAQVGFFVKKLSSGRILSICCSHCLPQLSVFLF